MKSPIITREKIQVNIAEEITSFAYKAGTILGAVVGVWAISCLVSALIRIGPVELVKGYITAITGY